MKTLYVLSFAVLGLIPAVSNTTVSASAATSAVERTVSVETELLAQLKAQVTSSDATLSRPL